MILSQQAKIPVRVTGVERVTPSIKTFTFEREDSAPLPSFSGGSHIVVEMRGGERTYRNPYSLMSPPEDYPSAYQISVRCDDQGRGGSQYMHERVREGDEMTISGPANLFPLTVTAPRHVLIAGGIGITPFLAQLHELRQRGLAYELHYQYRDAEGAAFRDRLAARFGDQTRFYESGRDQYVDPTAILADQPLGTHAYVCGPAGLTQAVHEAAAELGWPARNVHSEEFAAPPPGKPFKVVLERSQREVEVPANASALEAIEEAGIQPSCSCRGGSCGQCEQTVLEGDIDHNDHFLSDEAKARNSSMMICVSRARSDRVVLDL